MNELRLRWAAVNLLLLMVAIQAPGLAQAGGNPLQELWDNLQDLQDTEGNFPYAEMIQSDPVKIGSVYAGRINGIDQAMWRPSGSVSADGQSTTITINGRNAIIHIDQDRSDALVAGYSFQFEITEIRNTNGVKYSKANPWDNWPTLKTTSSGVTVSTHFDVGDATDVVGVIRASTLSRPGAPSVQYADGRFVVKIERDPRCMALGSFSIPVFPVSILYAPTPGENGKTTVQYVDEQSVTTKVSTTITGEQSQTVPADYSGMGGLSSILSGLQAVGTVVGLLNPAAGAIIGKCASACKDAIGTYDESAESGTKQQVVDGSLFLSSSSLGQTVGGENDDGTLAEPGKDDRLVLLRGLRLAWVAEGANNPMLISLGAKQIEMIPVRKIANDIAVLAAVEPPPPEAGPADSGHVGDLEFGQTGTENKPAQTKGKAQQLDSKVVQHINSIVKALETEEEQLTDISDLETLRSLFVMDPLAFVGPDVDFDQPYVKQHYGDRFQAAYFVTQWGMADELNTEFPTEFETVSMSTSSHAQTGTQFQTSVDDDKPGWFGKYILGYQTKKVKTSSTLSASTETSLSTRRQVKLHWERSSAEVVLRAYYDCVFGTYIFREVANTYRQTSSIATDDDGNPLPNQMLRFEINGRSVLARTDEDGKYTVYSSNPDHGAAKITLGKRVMTLDVTPAKKKVRPLR